MRCRCSDTSAPARLLVLGAVACLSFSCATVRAPEGGPVDTTPPEVIATDPPNRSIRYAGRSFSFEFSEYVEHASAENSLHISPLPAEPPDLDWSGTTLRVTFPHALRPNTTYVLTLGTEVVDRNNRNKMAHGFTLAVSTGDSIDAGFARGSVSAQNPAGVSIFGYRLDGRDRDTLNPSLLQPDYVAQTGADGSFSFDNIAEGAYRFFAVRDKLKNLLYDLSTDEFGVLPADRMVRRNDTASLPMRFTLSLEDTARPSIQSVTAVDGRHLLAILSKAPAPEDVRPEFFILRDSAGAGQALLDAAQQGVRGNQIRLTTAAAMRIAPYTLRIDSLRDPSGNLISPIGNPAQFTGSDAADSLRPALTLDPADKERGVIPDSAIRINFSDAVRAGEPGVTLRDSSGNAVPFRLEMLRPHTAALRPAGMREGMTYTLCIDLSRFRKATNNLAAADTTSCARFTTRSEEEYGSLEGRLEPAAPPAGGDVIVEARPVEGGAKSRVLRARVGGGGAYAFSKIAQGKYLLWAFQDRNGNGAFDPGKPFPFRPAELFSAPRDTIRVRAQWSTRDVLLPFPPVP